MRRTTADYESDSGKWVGDARRLNAVHATGLLDAPREPSFDRLTALAAHALSIPATFVSLLDANREFFVSSFGMPESRASQREVFGKTMCSFVIQKAMPLVVDDVREDILLKQVAEFHQSSVRAYLGVPLLIDGEAVGAFCGLDWAPRAWSNLEIELMRELAHSAEREIYLKMMKRS